MTFNRKPPPRVRSYPTPIPESQRRNAVFSRMDVPAAQPIEKDDALRSEPYRRLVAAMPCAICGRANRSQHAHTNAGKAKAMKNDARDAMPLCADGIGIVGCHTLFDQSRLILGGREAHIALGARLAAETRAQIEASGRWPKNLPRWTE